MQKAGMAAALVCLLLAQAIRAMVVVVAGQLFMLTLLAVRVSSLFATLTHTPLQRQPQAHQQLQ
jgi:hypothetical protein